MRRSRSCKKRAKVVRDLVEKVMIAEEKITITMRGGPPLGCLSLVRCCAPPVPARRPGSISDSWNGVFRLASFRRIEGRAATFTIVSNSSAIARSHRFVRETRLAQLTLQYNLDMPCRAAARGCRGSHRAIALDLTLSRAFQLWVLMGVITGSVKSLDARLSPAKGECANRRGM